jgi:phenylalanine dehydrogenase
MSTFQSLKPNQTEETNRWRIFDQIQEHEQVLFCNDEHSGLKAIIAIHDTTLGPALGGCRMRPYQSEEEALQDVLRLAKGMTYKCAAADVDFGGGKAVIIGDPLKDKTPDLFRALGQFVESIGGRYYTGCDMGTLPEDFVHAAKETNFIVGTPEEYGGSGDSSVPTSYGVMQGIRAASQFLWGTTELRGKRFAVQGLGKVGFKVAETLLKEGAHVYVTDIYEESIQKLVDVAFNLEGDVMKVSSENIYSMDADMFVPCAIGGILNDQTIEVLKVKAICGAANNQLLEDRHGDALSQKGILYAPDYIANAGGLIQVSDELYGGNRARVLKKTEAIFTTLLNVFEQAEREGLSTVQAANRWVENKLERRRRGNSFFTHRRKPKWDIRR